MPKEADTKNNKFIEEIVKSAFWIERESINKTENM